MGKVFRVKTWGHIFIEGYCAINQDYDHKHSKFTYGFKGNKDPATRGKIPNPDYDPNAKPEKKPDYCKGHICMECLRAETGSACPHLLIGEVEKKLKKRVRKTINKYYGES